MRFRFVFAILGLCTSVITAGSAVAAPPGTVRHSVFFRYKPTVTFAERREVVARFLALRDESRWDGRPVVQSIDTGTNSSHEQAAQNMDQGFIVTFRSTRDRDYYVGQPTAGAPYPAQFDPAHDRFKRWLGASGYLDDSVPIPVFVFDFTVEN